jgi:hypothetical protein
VQGEHREQGALLVAAQRDRRPPAPGLERPENRDLQVRRLAGARGAAGRSVCRAI